MLSAAAAKAQTVYITDGGKKYHLKNCSVVKTGKKGIDLADAKKQGYTACAVCKPDEKHEDKPATKNESKEANKPSDAKSRSTKK